MSYLIIANRLISKVNLTFDIKGHVQNTGYDVEIGNDVGCCLQIPMAFIAVQRPTFPLYACAKESLLLVPWLHAPSFCECPQLAPQRMDEERSSHTTHCATSAC